MFVATTGGNPSCKNGAEAVQDRDPDLSQKLHHGSHECNMWNTGRREALHVSIGQHQIVPFKEAQEVWKWTFLAT